MFKDYTATPLDELPFVCVDPGVDPTAWPFPLVYSAVVLFEALPQAFTFDQLTAEGERQGLSAARTVEHLRTWQDLGMVEIARQRVRKTGEKPYF